MFALSAVLLVDDDETTNFLHKRLLKRMKIAPQIAVVGNGEEALHYLQQHCAPAAATAATHCPNLIFLDINMPVMDGFDFLAEYERLYQSSTETVIVVLTTSVNPLDKERIKKFGSVKKYIVKPLSETVVNELLAECFA